MSDWEWRTLGDIASSQGYGLVDGPFGSNLPASCYVESGIPVIRGSNLTLGTDRFVANEFVYVSEETASQLERSLARPSDIVFTKKGTIGQTGLIPNNLPYDVYLISSNQMKLTVDESVADPIFVYYYVSSKESQNKIKRDSEFTGVPKTNTKYLREFPIYLPPLQQQKQIAKTLDSLDRKIENLRKQNETLEAIAQTLFKHWFIDFEFPNEDGKPYKSSDGEMVRSELGEIPVGWRVLTLKEICETIYRYPQFYGMDKSDKGVPVIRGEHLLPNGKISNDFSDYWFVSDEFSEKFPRTILKKFDVVLSVRGSVGNYSWVGNQHIGVQISPNTIRLSANPNILHDCLLYPFLKGCNFKNRLLQTVSSSAVPAINASEFKTFDFIIPSLSVQEQISPLFRDIYQKIDANEHQMQTLTKTRDVLLPKLMSGKLRITE